MAANIGLDPIGHQRETFLMATALIKFHMHMSPQRKQDVQGLPQSAMNIILGVLREHRRQGITPPVTKGLRNTLKGMIRKFVRRFGPRRMIPRRARPMQRRHVLDMIAGLPSHQGIQDMSWVAALAILSQAGMRGDELVHTDSKGLSCAHIAFKINGRLHSFADASRPTAQVLATLGRGDFLVITPPPSKSDQFGMVWGALPIYIHYDARDPANAAIAVQRLLLAHPPQVGQEASTPLLRRRDGATWSKPQLDSALVAALTIVCTPEERQGLTIHSFRVMLACQLLEAGASPAQIQALLRWQTEESLRLYARLTDETAGRWLRKAQKAKIAMSDVARMPIIDGWQSIDALSDALDGVSGTALHMDGGSATAPHMA